METPYMLDELFKQFKEKLGEAKAKEYIAVTIANIMHDYDSSSGMALSDFMNHKVSVDYHAFVLKKAA